MQQSKKILPELSTALLILLFVYTATSKLMDFTLFRVVLMTSPLIGEFGNVLAWTIPFTELILSLLLLFTATRKFGLVASLVLLSAFTLYIIAMISFSYQQSCTCGGVIRQLSWKAHLVFNGFFIALTTLALRSISPTKTNPLADRNFYCNKQVGSRKSCQKEVGT